MRKQKFTTTVEEISKKMHTGLPTKNLKLKVAGNHEYNETDILN